MFCIFTLIINIPAIIIPNKLGAYYSTTTIGCNTRKYHGAFVVPSEIEGKQKLLLISSIDETLIQNGAEYNLGVHEYSAGYFSPNGQNYIRQFDYNSNSLTITYRAGGTLVEKTLLLCENENRLIIKYRVLSGNTSIKIEPTLAFRDTSELCIENKTDHKAYQAKGTGIALSLYDKYPTLSMQISKKGEFVATGYWKNGLEYFNERDRGYHDREDLYVAGHFVVEAKEGEEIYFTAGLKDAKIKDIENAFNSQIKNDSAITIEDALKQTAESMFVEKNGKSYMMAGYPWYKCVARNMAISIPGLIAAGTSQKEIDAHLSTLGTDIEKMMSESQDKDYDQNIVGIEQPDVILWYTKAIQDYANAFGKNAAKKKYADKLSNIIDFIKAGLHINIEFTNNALLYIHGWKTPMTWMNALGGFGELITPRSGWTVEINALWYNTLRFAAELVGNSIYDQLAEKVADSEPVPEVKEEAKPVVVDNDGIEEIPENYWKAADHKGKLESLNYTVVKDGKELNKSAMVYLPYGYNKNDKNKRYNVVYLFHGGGDNYTSFYTDPRGSNPLNNILDHLIEDGRMEPVIVVTPTNYNGLKPYYEEQSSTDPDKITGSYPDEMIECIIPAVGKAYNTYLRKFNEKGIRETREHRAVGGFSMGSLYTWYFMAAKAAYVRNYIPLSGDIWAYDKAGNRLPADGSESPE